MGVRVEPNRLVAPWLRQVGWKHRRARMINPSFLVTHMPMRWQNRANEVGGMLAGAVLVPGRLPAPLSARRQGAW